MGRGTISVPIHRRRSGKEKKRKQWILINQKKRKEKVLQEGDKEKEKEKILFNTNLQKNLFPNAK